MTAPLEVIDGHPSSPLVIHVPHAATYIPAAIRDGIVLSDEDLQAEATRMADVATDVLALEAAARVFPRPWILINRLSRLVVDPERFPDDREPMNDVGMGAVYRRTSAGQVLRRPDAARDAQLIEHYFRPYATAMEDLVADRLAVHDRCVIIDLHSYPKRPLPYEASRAPRPPVCLGTDPFHTPDWLLHAVQNNLLGIGQVLLNTPFAGTYVPLRFYRTERRVASIMIELRRDTYTGARSTRWTLERAGRALAAALNMVNPIDQ